MTDRIVVIHISNDPGVPSLFAPPDDACRSRKSANEADRRAQEKATRPSIYGEVTSPLVALLNTREARGELSRRALVRELPAGHVFHFRLCEGEHHLPLGWTLSDAGWLELGRQLGGETDLNAMQNSHIRTHCKELQQ